MKTILFTISILLASVVYSQEDESKKLEFSIKGKVFDAETKKPIADASVKLKSSDGNMYEMKTDKKGKYEFGEKAMKDDRYVLPNMKYTVTVSASGYQESSQDEDTAGAEESITFSLDFSLQKKK